MTEIQREIERSLAQRGQMSLDVWAVETAGRMARDEASMLDLGGRVKAIVNSLEPADENWFAVLIGLLWGLALAVDSQPEALPEGTAAPGQAPAGPGHRPME